MGPTHAVMMISLSASRLMETTGQQGGGSRRFTYPFIYSVCVRVREIRQEPKSRSQDAAVTRMTSSPAFTGLTA